MSSFPLSPFGSMWGGLGVQNSITFDYGDAKPTAEAPKVQKPTKRPYLMPYGMRGQLSGFGVCPALTTQLCWQMRRYPTIVKVFALLTEPVLAGTRSIEIEDDGGNPKLAEEIKKAAESDLLPMLDKAMPGALESLHFGHWLQEIQWDKVDNRIMPVDVLPVLPNEAVIHIDEYRRFTGFQIHQDYRDARYGFLAVNDPHIDPVLGVSCNGAALISWFRATKSAENADAVERKAAGIQMFLHIMEGVEFKQDDGTIVKATDMARQWMEAGVTGASALVPSMAFSKESIEQNPELAKVPLITMDRFDWGNMGPILEAHMSRMRGLDVDIFAAYGVPERAGMESQHGSRADAEAHGDVVVARCERLHGSRVAQWDIQVKNRWQEANFPKSGVKIKTVPAPLADPQQSFLQQLTTALAANQQAAPEIIANLDKRKLLERVEAPVVTEEEATKNLADAEAKQQAADAVKAKQMTGPGSPDRMKQMNGGNGKTPTASR